MKIITVLLLVLLVGCSPVTETGHFLAREACEKYSGIKFWYENTKMHYSRKYTYVEVLCRDGTKIETSDYR